MSSYSWEDFGIGTDQIKIDSDDIFYLDNIDTIANQDDRLLKKINKYSMNVPVAQIEKRTTKPTNEIKFLYKELNEMEKKNDNMMLLLFFLIIIVIVQCYKNKNKPVMMLIANPNMEPQNTSLQKLNAK